MSRRSPSARLKLSPGELRLLTLIDARKQTTEELADRYYAGQTKPEHYRIVISGMLRRLEKKTQSLPSANRVKRSERRGPYSTTVWV
jgi:hypothetical protein